MNGEISIYWFRQDLRLRDNAALMAAFNSGHRVIPLYIWSPKEEGRWPAGGRSRWWLHQSLTSLIVSLKSLGLPLIIRTSPALTVLENLINETGATSLYLNRRFEPAAAKLDREILSRLAAMGIQSHLFNDTTLFDPDAILTRAGDPFKVFTPFWKHLLSQDDPGWSIRKSRPKLETPSRITGQPLTCLGLLNKTDPGSYDGWSPGEEGALKQLRRFLKRAWSNYDRDRDRPDLNNTSRLSPHLHFGEISPRRVWHEIRKVSRETGRPGAEAYLRQLAWREFSYYLLHHFPETPEMPWRRQFKSFPWRNDPEGLRRWVGGTTGYPLVDAGMRELRVTGWMHNRARLVTASFLTKHLLIHWLEGAGWFWDKLLDADLANNTMGWQWIAGCGADAAPYFRIFNPVLQGRRHDPDGDYVRRWLPELASLPNRHIHAPWKTPDSVLVDSKIKLGQTYPHPMVDHAEARQRALATYQQIRKGSSQVGGVE